MMSWKTLMKDHDPHIYTKINEFRCLDIIDYHAQPLHSGLGWVVTPALRRGALTHASGPYPPQQPTGQPAKNSLHRSISSTKHHQLILIESRSGASAKISQRSFNSPNLDSCREGSRAEHWENGFGRLEQELSIKQLLPLFWTLLSYISKQQSKLCKSTYPPPTPHKQIWQTYKLNLILIGSGYFLHTSKNLFSTKNQGFSACNRLVVSEANIFPSRANIFSPRAKKRVFLEHFPTSLALWHFWQNASRRAIFSTFYNNNTFNFKSTTLLPHIVIVWI